MIHGVSYRGFWRRPCHIKNICRVSLRNVTSYETLDCRVFETLCHKQDMGSCLRRGVGVGVVVDDVGFVDEDEDEDEDEGFVDFVEGNVDGFVEVYCLDEKMSVEKKSEEGPGAVVFSVLVKEILCS